MDLSTLSNDELMQIAGVGSTGGGTDLSSFSNDDLFKIAGTQPVPESTQPTWGESARFVGKSLVEGVANTGGLLADIFPSLAPGGMSGSEIKQAVQGTFGSPDDEGITGAVPDVARAALNAVAFPGSPVVNALAGAGGEIGSKVSDNPLAPVVGALVAGGGAGLANKFSSALEGAGSAFERSSIGATGKHYVKSLRDKGLLLDDETGELSTRLSNAIEDISKKEGFGFWRDPQTLAVKNQSVLDDVGSKIGERLVAAEAAGAQPALSFQGPNSAVENLINSSKAEKKQIRDAFDEFLDVFTDPKDGWDGTLTGLNSWKSSLGNQAFSGSASGTLAPQVARKLQRAIYSDMQASVNDAVVNTGVAKPQDWAGLMSQYSNHKEIAPILNEAVARGLGESSDKLVRGLLRTSGGTLTGPALIGGALTAGAAGPIAGLAAGAGLAAVSSPTGRGVAGNTLKALGKAGQVATESAALGPIAAAVSESTKTPTSDLINSLFGATTSNSAIGSIFQGGDKMSTDPVKVQKIEAKIDADPIDSAIYEAESGRNPLAKNPKSTASGAFQLLSGTAKSLGVKDPFDIEQNYTGYRKLREEHQARFGDSPELLYSAHYLGATVLDKVLKKRALSDKERAQVEYLKRKALPDFMKIYNAKINTDVEQI